MKLSRQIANHGIKVTFVNIESVHARAVIAVKISGDQEEEDNIVLVSIPDGQSSEANTLTLFEALRKSMPQSLTDLIERINSSNPDEKITCVIADVIIIGCILETAQNMGAEPIAFAPFSAACLATMLQIPSLLERGILDSNGNVKKSETISLSDDIPWPRRDEFVWSSSDKKTQEMFFESSRTLEKTVHKVKLVLINTCYELESSACDLNPKLLPIAPITQTITPTSSSNSGDLYLEDESCLSWLNNKPAGSVIYVSFDSSAMLSQQQLDELALGLELSGRAFLWVVRSNLANGSPPVYPNGFLDRVRKLGKIVGWAPQEKVLSHPSIACFFSHCGWNSTLEGLSMGVPFLCWPYFADQFQNQSYICDKWEIGLRVDPDEEGIRSRHEIKLKLDMLFSTDNLKANALTFEKMYAKSIIEGGFSYKNLKTFIEHASNK